MPGESTPAGATPAAEGAMPSQSQPAQPAPGATPEPAAAPAAGSQSTPEPPATGKPEDQLGDPGKRALTAERTARQTAEQERDALRSRVETLENATRSDQEKAIADARKEATAEVTARAEAGIRTMATRAALTAAGITASELDLAARAPEFATLKVKDLTEVEGLTEAAEAFKAAHPALFPSQRPTGDFGGGARSGQQPSKPASLEDAVEAHYQGQGS